MIKNITTTAPAFDLSKAQIGYLVSVFDQSDQLIGAGVIICTSPWTLGLALHTGESRWEENVLKGMIPWNINIEQVVTGEFKLFLIDPQLLRD